MPIDNTARSNPPKPKLTLIEERRSSDSLRFQTIFDHASDAVLTFGSTGKIEEVNRAAEDMTGYLREELIASSIMKLSPDPSKHRLPERARALTQEWSETEGTYEDIAILRKDGYIRWVEMTVRKAPVDSGEMTIILLRDVSEKKRMERDLISKHAELRSAYLELEKRNTELKSMQETLIQAGKMAALGELAFGIAHELNQPLQAIRGFAQELGAVLVEPSSTSTECLKEIESAVEKIHGIITYLRGHVRQQSEVHEMVDVKAACQGALRMLSKQLQSRNIQVTQTYSDKLSSVFAHALQLEQVVINLATNARDAIQATGRGSGNIWITARDSGEFVEIEFKDDGCGMSEKTRQKAFNPFFTTKEVGQGMGLGLSLSYGVISKLHGALVIESELGKGTAFKIRLPKDYRELA